MAKRLIPWLLLLLLPATAPARQDGAALPRRGWHWFEPAALRNRRGIEAYRRGDYAAALEQFLSAKGLKADAPELKNNTAAALYQLQKFRQALEELSSVDAQKPGPDQATLHYNLGNVHFRLEQYPQALESYKRCLLLAADDIQAKKNFELTLRKLQERQPQEQPQPPEAEQQQQQKYEAMMQFLDQNEKQQMEKRKRKASPARNEKDW